jgi:hypothetical protein
MDDLFRPGTEAPSSDERSRERAYNHIDFGRVDILMLRDTTAASAQNAERPCLVKNKPEFVFELQLHLTKTLSVNAQYSQ